MATNPKKELKKFEGMAQRPLVIDPSLIHLFIALGEKRYCALILAMVVQRIAHMTAKTKSLNLETQEYFDLFPFVDTRYLRKCVYALREYGIWKNKRYIPHSKMASYANIRISWPAIAELAKKVQKGQLCKTELKAMCQRMTE